MNGKESSSGGLIQLPDRVPDNNRWLTRSCEGQFMMCLSRWGVCLPSKSIEREMSMDELRVLSRVPFNKSEAGVLLSSLYMFVYPNDTPPISIPDSRWQLIGFQSKNPLTDFRTGQHALVSLAFIMTAYDVSSMMLSASKDYPFAVSVISLSYTLLMYFGLVDALPSYKGKLATEKGQKRLADLHRKYPQRDLPCCGIQSTGKNGGTAPGDQQQSQAAQNPPLRSSKSRFYISVTVLDEVLAACVLRLHDEFLIAKSCREPGVSEMDSYKVAMDKTIDALDLLFASEFLPGQSPTGDPETSIDIFCLSYLSNLYAERAFRRVPLPSEARPPVLN